MSIVTQSTWQAAAIPPFPVWRFSVGEYHQLIAAGVLEEDAAVELLEGWIVPKMARGSRHDASMSALHGAIGRQLSGWHVRVQSALTTSNSEPEPDLAIVEGEPLRYFDCHPTPGDAALVAEVSETSLAHDRDVKGRVFAAARIAVYWVVNLVDRRIEVYTLPVGSGGQTRYSQRDDFVAGQSVPLVVGGKTLTAIAVNDVLR